jgi:hypothetical protein
MWHAQRRTLLRPPANVYFEDYGAGPPVLIVSGAEEHPLLYTTLVLRLVRAGLRVLLMSMRGHWLSPCPPAWFYLPLVGGDVLAILDASGLARAARGRIFRRFSRHARRGGTARSGRRTGAHGQLRRHRRRHRVRWARARSQPVHRAHVGNPGRSTSTLPRRERKKALLDRNFTMLGSRDGRVSLEPPRGWLRLTARLGSHPNDCGTSRSRPPSLGATGTRSWARVSSARSTGK